MLKQRSEQLDHHDFLKEECKLILTDEYAFYLSWALMKTTPLSTCLLLEYYSDKECVSLFGFDRLSIKYFT